MKKHTISFINAFNGLIWTFTTQPNFRVHFFLSFSAIISGWFFKISYFEFLTILLLIFIGLTIESINTAIEEATDAIDNEWREDIKIAKDVSAAAMLIFSAGALVIACIIFIPKIIQYFQI